MNVMELAARVLGKLETALEVYAQKTRAERDNALLYRDVMELELKERTNRLVTMRLVPEGYLGPRQTYLANLAKHTQTVVLTPPAKADVPVPTTRAKPSWMGKKTKPLQRQKPEDKPLTHHMSIPTPPTDAPVEEPKEQAQDEAKP